MADFLVGVLSGLSADDKITITALAALLGTSWTPTFSHLITANAGLNASYITTQVQTIASAATITPPANCTMYTVTALAVAATIAPPAGSPVDGQELVLRIQDNGTGQSLSWNAIYIPCGCVLPTTTSGGSVYIGGKYNAQYSTWDILAVAQR